MQADDFGQRETAMRGRPNSGDQQGSCCHSHDQYDWSFHASTNAPPRPSRKARVQWSLGVGEGVAKRLPEAVEPPEPGLLSDGSGDSRGSGLFDGAAEVGAWRTGAAGGAAWGAVGVDSGVGLRAGCMTDLARSAHTSAVVLPAAAHALTPRPPVSPP